MKKDKCYNSDCCIDVSRKKIVAAHCRCVSCVHVSALLHSIECLFESSKNSRLVASAVGESRTSHARMLMAQASVKVAVYSLLMNYSYEAFYCYWAESLLLAQISMMYNEFAPKIMSCSKKNWGS